MNRLRHVTVDYNEDFSLNVYGLLSAIDAETSMVVILNPNSPIGAVYSERETETIIEKARSVGALVIVDEAYHYFFNKTFMTFSRKYDNVIILRTFSKLCSIAGLRVGYAAGNPALIDVLERAEATFNVNAAGILFAEEILKRPDIMEQMRAEEAEGRAWLTLRLRAAGYDPLALEGNFVLFKPKKPSTEIVAELNKRNIRTRDYQSGALKGYLRVSTGGAAFMRRFWEAFERAESDGNH
jgi:histidinol-phosphate aminotransferase